MTTKAFIEKYQGKILEDDGAYKSAEFIAFAKAMRSVINSELKRIGAKLTSFSVGHYDVSGFVERGGQYVYFSYSEPRHLPIDLTRTDAMMGILVRTADGPKDYRGGINNFTNITSFADLVDRLLN